jgi:citrate lyase beta subunit
VTSHDGDTVFVHLSSALTEESRRYPGDGAARQPVHTVYGGAHLFRAATARRLGELARAALARHAPTAADLAAALGWAELGVGEALAGRVYERVVEKLGREPVEDFRIDFEDGYGNRPDDEEDGDAEAAARQVARGMAGGSLPPFVGIRIKPLTAELNRRALRTLERFVDTLVEAAGGALPAGFAVTLPKVTLAAQVETLAVTLDRLERRHDLDRGAVRVELMVETPRSIFAPDGAAALPALVAAADGRCRGAHFGTYDYTAALGITAAHQRMDHPVCDFAKQVMQVALAGTGVWLSDGATNVLPVAPHRAADGTTLGGDEEAANRAAVHAAWRLHHRHVRHSLAGGFYQGWDLHPAQLPTRYAAVYAFFWSEAPSAGERLRGFIAQAARATLSGGVFDDAATGQGLLNFFLRAVGCGALSEAEARELSGLGEAELRSRSFVDILAVRQGSARSGGGEDD